MAAPPLLAGGVHVTVAWPLPAVAVTAVGASGTNTWVLVTVSLAPLLLSPPKRLFPMMSARWRIVTVQVPVAMVVGMSNRRDQSPLLNGA